MRTAKHILRFIFSLYAFAVFLFWMIALFPFFCIAFALPRPKDGNMVYKIARLWAILFFTLIGIRFRIRYKKKPDPDHSYIFVTNHISYLDIPMMILATKGFPVRILAKSEMSSIPLFGWIYRAGAVTVKRDNPENRRESILKLKRFLSEKISILICPEGTFNMTNQPLKNFYDGAFKIAIELNKPIVPIIFPDTNDRMHYRSVFSITPGLCRAIFLPAIPAEGLEEKDVQHLKDRVYAVMEQEIRQLQVSWIN